MIDTVFVTDGLSGGQILAAVVADEAADRLSASVVSRARP